MKEIIATEGINKDLKSGGDYGWLSANLPSGCYYEIVIQGDVKYGYDENYFQTIFSNPVSGVGWLYSDIMGVLTSADVASFYPNCTDDILFFMSPNYDPQKLKDIFVIEEG